MFEARLLIHTPNVHRPLVMRIAMISKISITTSMGQEEIEIRYYLYLSYVEFLVLQQYHRRRRTFPEACVLGLVFAVYLPSPWSFIDP